VAVSRSRAALLLLLIGCTPNASDAPTGTAAAATVQAGQAQAAAEDPAAAALRAKLDREFPLYGLVTGLQLKVRTKPDPEATLLGWLRIGSSVRLAREPQKTKTCASGWYALHPNGFACAGEGIEVGERPPESPLAFNPPAEDAPLPYAYYFVKDPKAPEFHRLPSRDDQRASRDFADRYLALAAKDPKKAERFLHGELKNEMLSPAVVRGYLERGFFVAGAGFEERAFRKFVRTVRGRYVKASQLEPRHGSDFQGVVLDDTRTLPVAWAVREAQPFTVKTRDDGTLRFVPDATQPPFPRLAVLPWAKHTRLGTELLHELSDGRYIKHWFAAVAERIERPKEIGADQPWVHVNIEQQTLVLYEGDKPVYATLVSSGLEGHDTPIGLFQIRAKHVAASMSDIGPEVGEDLRYSIEDVPWTQYFDGSVALHGAFWHERFGLRRSHGCINLAPRDAHHVFNHTWPQVPTGWHGITTEGTQLAGSKVWITAQ
jgi:hypothetical protein